MRQQRPRHPRPELEQLIREAEALGWRVTKAKRYYKAQCPCENKCQEYIHLTPSDPKYARNKRNKMAKCKLWKE